MKKLLFVLALIFNVPAFAGALPSYTPSPSGGTLFPGSLSDIGEGFRDWSANDAGDVFTRDRVRVPVGAANADMFVNRRIPFRSVLVVGGRLLGVAGVAASIYELYKSFGCQWVNGSIVCDGGTNPDTGWRYAVSGVPGQYMSLGAACSAAQSSFGWAGHVVDDRGYVVYCTELRPNGSWGGSAIVTKSQLSNTTPCEQLANGKCAGGESLVMTPEQAADYLLPHIDKSQSLPIARDAAKNGIDLSPYAQPLPATGPASISQPSTQTVTQSPNGTTSISTVTTTNNITYNGDTYNITNTTIKNNPDGSTETTTEAQKDQSQCAKSPNSLACIELGSPPSESPTWQTRTVVYQAESLGLPAGCPAPWSGTVHGWNLSMSWQPACDVADQVRAGVLALAALSALLMIITTVRS